jgi:TM2 domain-containing membrane protein YozV
MAKVIEIMPDLHGDEMILVQKLIQDMDDEQARMFSNAYRTRRRDPLLVLLTACLGLVGFAGIQRFILNQIGLGLLYFFTAGLCLIGTIVDMVNYQRLAYEYNSHEAQQVASMIKGISA